MTNKEAIDILINCFKPPIIRNDGKSMAHLLALEAIQKAVDALEAEPIKHGRWVEDALPFNGIALEVYRCTACGEPFWTNPAGYCPHCGAKMDEPEAEPCASD